MPVVRGAKYREDLSVIEKFDIIYQEEIKRINEQLKNLNEERKNFESKIFGGFKGLINKNRNIIFEKKDLVSKYGLSHFTSIIKRIPSLNARFNDKCVDENPEKIPFVSIYAFYDMLEENLLAATYFVQMVAEYKESDYNKNGLTQVGKSAFAWEWTLTSFTEEIFNYISNPEIRELGKRMFEEYLENSKESEKVQSEIDELQRVIKDKLLKSSNKGNLEQLKEYKKLLEEVSNLLPEDEIIKNNGKK